MDIKIANNMVENMTTGAVSKRPVVSTQQSDKIMPDSVSATAETSKLRPEESDKAKERSPEDMAMMEAILDQIKEDLNTDEHEVAFSFNDTVKQMVVTVKNKNSGEVIRKIPEDYVLKLFEKFHVSGTVEGVLIDNKV